MPPVTLFLLLLAAPAAAIRTCSSISSCERCVTRSSWLGSCQWCPTDGSCRSRVSVFTPCARADHFRSTEECARPAPAYSPALARSAALLSAVAYSPAAARYLGPALPGHSFSDVTHVTEDEYSAFVATWSSQSLIVIAVRGTETRSQLVQQAISVLTTLSTGFLGGKVQRYFHQGFDKLWNGQGLEAAVRRSVQSNPGARVLVTGHSLGGAIASLISAQLVAASLVPRDSVLLYTFGMPRVGDYDYALAHDSRVPHSFRITQDSDPVPHLPTCIQLGCTLLYGPYHHGKEVFYRRRTSSTNYVGGWKLCKGLPFNEDVTCANSVTNWAGCLTGVLTADCVDDHLYYFGVDIGDWWKDH